MANKSKYLVLSVKNLRDMLAVAEAISAKHGCLKDHTDCVIYGVEVDSKLNRGQVNIVSARAVANAEHYNPTTRSNDGELLPYRGETLTYVD